MQRKKYTFASSPLSRKLRHRFACKRWRLRIKEGIRLNRPRVSDEELDVRALKLKF